MEMKSLSNLRTKNLNWIENMMPSACQSIHQLNHIFEILNNVLISL